MRLLRYSHFGVIVLVLPVLKLHLVLERALLLSLLPMAVFGDWHGLLLLIGAKLRIVIHRRLVHEPQVVLHRCPRFLHEIVALVLLLHLSCSDAVKVRLREDGATAFLRVAHEQALVSLVGFLSLFLLLETGRNFVFPRVYYLCLIDC